MHIVSDPEISPISNEEIALFAFLIYEREGRPTGREHEHWHQAEAQLCAMRAHEQANGNGSAASGDSRR